MEIVGTIVAPIGLALVEMILGQGIKKILPEEHHKYLPIPLALICGAIGVAWSFWGDTEWWKMMISGFGVAALAVFGWEFFEIFQHVASLIKK